MIALFRIIFILPIVIITSIVGMLASIARPFHRNNTYTVSQLLYRLAPLFGIKVIVRVPHDISSTPKVMIANHQNSFDVVTISSGVTPGVVSLGKKSLVWVPFFGQLYWLSGNILIDRKNKSKAIGTISQTADKMISKQLSVWIFPEGTRSNGRGLLPFKTGAFHTAIQANVDVVPIVMNSTDHIRLNRWNNGTVIIESLPAMPVSEMNKGNVRDMAQLAHENMKEALVRLDAEVAELNKK